MPEYAYVEMYFRKKDWLKVIDIVDRLDKKGIIDRAITVAKGKAYARMGDYKRSLMEFANAQGQSYVCVLSWPTIPTTSYDMAYDGILWFNIHEVYFGMEDTEQSAKALEKAMGLMKEALKDFIPQEEIIAKKFLSIYSIYADKPW